MFYSTVQDYTTANLQAMATDFQVQDCCTDVKKNVSKLLAREGNPNLKHVLLHIIFVPYCPHSKF